MKMRPRIYYTETDKALMWDHWQKGESLNSIARLFDWGHSSIQSILTETGGIGPRQRRRSCLALTLAEREEISRGVVAGYFIRSIAASLCRAPSTVSREIRRKGNRVTFWISHYRKSYFIGAYIRYDNLDDAVFADSPLIDTPYYYAVGFAFSWIFYNSEKRVPHR